MIGLVRLAANAVVLQRLVASTSLLLPASRCESFSLPAAPTSPRGPPRPHREVDPRVEPSRQRRRLRRWRRIPPSAAFAMPNDADGSPPPNDAMDYLRERARRQERQYAELFSAGLRRSEEGRPPESVHLLLFRPNTPVQSVHTIEYPMGSGDNWILAFEDGDDCEAFANDLRRDNLDFAVPSPEETMFEPFARHCEMSATRFVVVPGGFGLTPPQANVADRDYYSDDDDNEEDGSVEDEDDAMTDGEVAEEGSAYDLGAWG